MVRTIFTKWGVLSTLLLAWLLFAAQSSVAQVTITTSFTNNNGSSVACFNFANNSGGPVYISEIGSVPGITGTATPVSAWYKSSAITGAITGGINSGTGWTQFGAGTANTVSNTTTTVAQVLMPTSTSTLTQVIIPAGSTYGIAVECSSLRYSTLTAGVYTETAGGCSIITGDNVGYGGTLASPTNYPRGFIGYVKFIPLTPCVNPPSAGTVTGVDSICPNVPFSLATVGTTFGSGMTYQWQTATAAAGPWTDVAGSTTPNFTSTGINTPAFYRLKANCSAGADVFTPAKQISIKSWLGCYCTPTYSQGCSNGATIESFSTTGATTNISNLNTGCVGTGYTSYTPMVAGAIQTTSFTATTAISNYSGGVKIWIDWNQDGNFDPVTELAAASTATILSGSAFTGNITVPLTALPGLTRMRVRVVESSTTFGPCDAASYGETEDYGFNVIQVAACTNPPSAGVVSGVDSTCPNIAFSLNSTGVTLASGMTYQWQSGASATGPWTNIAGATNASYTSSTGISTATFYRLAVQCGTGTMQYSASKKVSIKSFVDCYCTPVYSQGCSFGATLESFATAGAATNISNLNSGCVGTGYTSYMSMVASAIQSSSFTATSTLSGFSGGVKIWIDWNQDGVFDPVTELVAASTATIASGSSFTETITVPLTALPGTTRMRVRVVESTTTFGPCDLASYGETEDYGFTVIQVAACTNPPSAGVLSGIDSICPNIAFTLNSTGVTLASGMTYQWQSGASATGPWTNIAGATSPNYTASTGITAATYYRLSVQCGTGTMVYSASKKVSVKSYIDCYCIPTYTYNCSSGDDIKDVILAGSVAPGINNLNTPCPATGYQDYSATMSATLIAGNTYSGNVTTSYTSASENVRIWIDYNQNGVFDSVETVGVIANINNLSTGAYTFTVPATVAAGTYKMRVRLVYAGNAATINPCSLESFGETHDYGIIITTGTTPCTNPVVNLGADTTICAGQTLTLNAGAANATYTKLWSNAATTQTINVTTAGTYSVTVTNGTCVGKDTIVVGVTPLPVVNLGADTAICAGSTLTLSAGAANSTYTKLWSNLATTQTIPVTTAGTYSVKVTNGACSKSDTVIVTVNPLPVVNLGADTGICTGSTLTLDAGNAGATYLWTGGTTAQTLVVTTAGTYGVTVTKNGCTATDSIAITATAPPTVGGITATGAAPNFVFTANGTNNVTTYAWTFGDGGTSGNAAPTHDYVQTNVDQTFTVTLIVSNACGSDTATTIVVVPKSTGVNNLQLNAKELKLYPNPAQQLVTVENDSKLKMTQIKITNILGQEVARIAVSNQAKQTINVADLAAGIYNVTIEFEEGTVNRKLEILK